MKPCRILLANRPRLLREMLGRAMAGIPGLIVVGEITDLTRLPSAVKQTAADWVVVSLARGSDMPRLVQRLLADSPHVGVLALAPDGGQARVSYPGRCEEGLVACSLDEVAAALREQPEMTVDERR